MAWNTCGTPTTLPQSIKACRIGGHMSLIGVLTRRAGDIPTAAMMARQQALKGLIVGSWRHHMDMVRGLETTGIRPIIDSTFAMARLADAFRHEEAGRHFGRSVFRSDLSTCR
ncbi:zinc-binding dehydrogenase [Fulvimarina sp. MAC3]|uniref:zinc-binding dehydrogenase n=1 Tax=Fulvimarina sp. MAC3 TaxID=3148887 RepID=UPI0031FE2037